jgi:hypothetical protein
VLGMHRMSADSGSQDPLLLRELRVAHVSGS